MLSQAQMIEVDRLMIEVYGITLTRMMENAGRSLTQLAIDHFAPERVQVLAGSGGNGGGALVAARHLVNRGVEVHVTLTRPDGPLTAVPQEQLDILRAMHVPVGEVDVGADLIVDGLIGYSLRGAPRGRALDLIGWANAHAAPTLSLDTPSGLEVSGGSTPGDAIRAAATLTLALPKAGLLDRPDLTGALWLADISVPRSLYTRMGLDVPRDLFAQHPIVRVPSSIPPRAEVPWTTG